MMYQDTTEDHVIANYSTNYKYLLNILQIRDFVRFEGHELHFIKATENGKFWRYFRHMQPSYHTHPRSSICLVCAAIELQKLTENNKGERDIQKISSLFTCTVYKTTGNGYAQNHVVKTHPELAKHHLGKKLSVEENEKLEALKERLCNFYDDFSDVTFENTSNKPLTENFSLFPSFKYYVATWMMMSG